MENLGKLSSTNQLVNYDCSSLGFCMRKAHKHWHSTTPCVVRDVKPRHHAVLDEACMPTQGGCIVVELTCLANMFSLSLYQKIYAHQFLWVSVSGDQSRKIYWSRNSYESKKWRHILESEYLTRKELLWPKPLPIGLQGPACSTAPGLTSHSRKRKAPNVSWRCNHVCSPSWANDLRWEDHTYQTDYIHTILQWQYHIMSYVYMSYMHI